ncbi:phage protein NinX family protein [Citrobacter freundii]|uniref:phage protein NinX family protein n=1 Tax=Citrobacter freundii TaxID=546 RepID=UPI0019000871|nr:phage protein NinX family protein [Citrobacter freundii]MBJ8879385.1 DUF2591 family protein [Citrobacter freundii]
MDYSNLSDFEINKRVADIEMNGTWHVKPSHPDNDTGGWLYGSNGIQTYELPDYCNIPANAWPIITSNRIALSPLFGGEWRASVDDECGFISYTCSTENPLRAAMTVFLMAQESANVPANSTGSDL